MPDFRPIPTPWHQRLNEARVQGLPVVVFFVAAVAALYLWDREVAPPFLTGEVYGIRSEVGAPEGGTLVDLRVAPFEDVEAGDLIATLRLQPDEQTAAELDVLRAELALARVGGLDPILDQERNRLNRQSLRRDWLQARAELASLEVRVREAEVEYRRLSQLFARDQVSASVYDRARANFDALAAEREERRRLAGELERIVQLPRPGDADDDLDERARLLEATFDWQEKRLRQLELALQPVELFAPTSGTVMRVHRQEGEYVPAGGPIVDISSRSAEFIVGYLRMPASIEPREGMAVTVALRGPSRQEASARVLRVGAGFEALGPAFRSPVALREERALALMISVPPGFPIRPGEVVDLRLGD